MRLRLARATHAAQAGGSCACGSGWRKLGSAAHLGGCFALCFLRLPVPEQRILVLLALALLLPQLP